MDSTHTSHRKVTKQQDPQIYYQPVQEKKGIPQYKKPSFDRELCILQNHQLELMGKEGINNEGNQCFFISVFQMFRKSHSDTICELLNMKECEEIKRNIQKPKNVTGILEMLDIKAKTEYGFDPVIACNKFLNFLREKGLPQNHYCVRSELNINIDGVREKQEEVQNMLVYPVLEENFSFGSKEVGSYLEIETREHDGIKKCWCLDQLPLNLIVSFTYNQQKTVTKTIKVRYDNNDNYGNHNTNYQYIQCDFVARVHARMEPFIGIEVIGNVKVIYELCGLILEDYTHAFAYCKSHPREELTPKQLWKEYNDGNVSIISDNQVNMPKFNVVMAFYRKWEGV